MAEINDFKVGLSDREEARYLSVSLGKFREKVEEGTKGAKQRTNKLGDKIFEREYSQFVGKIKEVSWREGEYGYSIWFTFSSDDDNIVIMMNNGSTANATLLKLLNCNPLSNVRLTTYFFEKPGEHTRAPIKMEQIVDGVIKTILPLYNKDNLHPKAPLMEKLYEHMSEGQRIDHWKKVDKFIIETIIPEVNAKIRQANSAADDLFPEKPNPDDSGKSMKEEVMARQEPVPEDDDLPF